MTQTHWGAWSFDRRVDEIADIAWHGFIVLRSIRAVVRDRDWATGDLRVDRVSVGQASLTLDVSCTDLGADFHGTVRVAHEDDALVVAFDAVSRGSFRANRVGLVVLQPHTLAGTPLRVEHPDGTREESAFPLAVSPHQPVLDIRSLGWRRDGVEVEVLFMGDTFEMEDQRNWTDASFKTYSRPLSLPFPYEIAAGDRIVQQVTVTAVGVAPPSATGGDTSIVLESGGSFPQIIVGAATAPDPAPAFDPFGDGVLVELDLSSTNWRAALERAAMDGIPLDVRLIIPPSSGAMWGTTTPGGIVGDELGATLTTVVTAIAPHRVLRIAAFDPITHVTEPSTTAALRTMLKIHDRHLPILEGARSHFTELNREQGRILTGADGITFALTPLFHTAGDEQLHESVAVQRVLAEQSVRIARGLPVHIGPVALQPRFNNVATTREAGPTAIDLSEGYGTHFSGSVDARQRTDALAAWTIASAAALAVPGVASLAYFEQWGARGVSSVDGEAFPVDAALRALAALAGGELLTGASQDGRLWALGGRTPEGVTVLAANLDSDSRAMTIVVPGADDLRITVPGRSYRRATPLSRPG